MKKMLQLLWLVLFGVSCNQGVRNLSSDVVESAWIVNPHHQDVFHELTADSLDRNQVERLTGELDKMKVRAPYNHRSSFSGFDCTIVKFRLKGSGLLYLFAYSKPDTCIVLFENVSYVSDEICVFLDEWKLRSPS